MLGYLQQIKIIVYLEELHAPYICCRSAFPADEYIFERDELDLQGIYLQN